MMTAVAIGLMVIASFCFAGGALLQHMTVRDNRTSDSQETLTARQVLANLKRPRWLTGLGLVILGALLHLTALSQAPVTVVQPIGILAVPWSVLLAARVYGYRTNRTLWGTVALTFVGIVGFTVLATRHSDDERSVIDLPSMVGAIIVCCGLSAVLVLIRRKVPLIFRSFAMASAGAVLYGLASAATKTVFVMVDQGWQLPVPVIVVAALAIVATYATGGWVIQQAYVVGQPEVVVGSLTTVDPLIAVAYGMVVLHEGVDLSPVVIVAMVIFGAVATAGVAGLSRNHPEARERARAIAAAQNAETAPAGPPESAGT